MLRPATPLSVLLFAAFALMLMAVLTTPIIKAIPLGEFKGVAFGVFGFCKPDGCSPIEIGYDTSNLFSSEDSATFNLPGSARTTLSAILVVHPIACLLTLVMMIMAIAAHFHSPSHSSRFLLILFIIGILNLIACLIAFLVDVLLFVPHMAWGSWLVLAATILVAISGLVSCAMRRTLVSRKSRKKRIAENAEMSGENYYNREAQAQATVSTRQPTMPVVSGAINEGEKLPVFATYEKKDDRSSDERMPLTARSPSDRSPNATMADGLSPADVQMMNGAPGPRRSPSMPRDQYGNPVNPSPDPYNMRRGPSFDRMNSRGRGAMPAPSYRGRGGYGRGGYGGPPPPSGRGGYGPPGRADYATPPPRQRGGYGPPPQRGYGGSARGRTPPPGYQYERSGPYGVNGPPQAPGYNPNSSMPSVATTGTYEAYTPDRTNSLPRAESPPPLPGLDGVGNPVQVVEMDAGADSAKDFGQMGSLRDSDTDIAGMVGLQQGRGTPNAGPRRHDTYMSDGSRYSQDDQYVPPRAAWNNGRNSPRMPSPLNVPGRAPAAGLSSSRSPPPGEAAPSNAYFEDVDPRFAEPAPRTTPPIPTSPSYEDIPQGARSPAESERSNFTSISQRGVNPRWNPPPPALMPGYNGQQVPRRPARNPNDTLLNENPDFALPRARGGNSPPRGPNSGMVPGSAYPAI